MYVGESSFDENGNQIGFVMKNPGTYGFDIKKKNVYLGQRRLLKMMYRFFIIIWIQFKNI